MENKIAGAMLAAGLLLMVSGTAIASPGVAGTILYGGVGGDTLIPVGAEEFRSLE